MIYQSGFLVVFSLGLRGAETPATTNPTRAEPILVFFFGFILEKTISDQAKKFNVAKVAWGLLKKGLVPIMGNPEILVPNWPVKLSH